MFTPTQIPKPNPKTRIFFIFGLFLEKSDFRVLGFGAIIIQNKDWDSFDLTPSWTLNMKSRTIRAVLG